MIEFKTKREYLLDKGYTEHETDLILKLEEYAHILDQRFENPDLEINFKELFKLIDSVQNDNVDEKIKSYSAYIHGAALPFYDETIKKEDLESTEEFNYVVSPVTGLKVKDWVTLIENYQKDGIVINEFNEKIKVSGSLTKYFERTKYKWALSIGVWHHFYIKKCKLKK